MSASAFEIAAVSVGSVAAGIVLVRVLLWRVQRGGMAAARRAADDFEVTVRLAPRFSAGVDCFDD